MFLKLLISKNAKKAQFSRAMISHKSISAAPPSSFSSLSIQHRVALPDQNQFYSHSRDVLLSSSKEESEAAHVREIMGLKSSTDDEIYLKQLHKYSYSQLKKIGRAFGIPINIPQETLLENIKKLQQMSISEIPAQVLQKLIVTEVNKIATHYGVTNRATKHDTLRVIREHDNRKPMNIQVFLTMINRVQQLDSIQQLLGVGIPSIMKGLPLPNGKLGTAVTSPLASSGFSIPVMRHVNKHVDPEELSIMKSCHAPKLKAFQLFMKQCTKESTNVKSMALGKNYLKKYNLESTFPTNTAATSSFASLTSSHQNYPVFNPSYFQQSEKELFTLPNNELLLSYLMEYYHEGNTSYDEPETVATATAAATIPASTPSTARTSLRSHINNHPNTARANSTAAMLNTTTTTTTTAIPVPYPFTSEMEEILPPMFMKKVITSTAKYYQDYQMKYPEIACIQPLTRKRISLFNSLIQSVAVAEGAAPVLTPPPSSTTTTTTVPSSSSSTSGSRTKAASSAVGNMLPLTVVGDILGSMGNVNQIFSEVVAHYPSEHNPYVFLGNMIQFQPYTCSTTSSVTNAPITISDLIGAENLAILLHLFHLKVSCPAAITMLQGKEEYELLQYLQYILDEYQLQRYGHDDHVRNHVHTSTKDGQVDEEDSFIFGKASAATTSTESAATGGGLIPSTPIFAAQYPPINVSLIPEDDIRMIRNMHRILSRLPIAAELENVCFLVSSGIGKQAMALTTTDMNHIMSMKGKSSSKMNLIEEFLYAGK